MTEKAGEESFVALFVESEPALRSFILSQVANWADMNEILQQTSLILWRKFDRYKPGTSFRSWAFKIARFEVLNFLKKQRRSKLIFSDETLELLAFEDPREEDILEEQRHALSACLAKLEPEQREILCECYEGDHTLKEVARLRARSLEGLYKLMQRLRASLLKCIEREIRGQEVDFA
ncbi:MAG: sigma-70 family RNA polymerase sigma factor [Verrucomicrobiales bacterium]